MRSIKIGFWLPIIGMLLFFTACNSSQQTSQVTSPTLEEENNSPLTVNENTVEVELSEFKIIMPNVIIAGEKIFKVTNVGDAPHNFEIEGNGIEKEFEANLAPGETQTMVVELKPGTYKVYCPVANHQEKGMSLQLTVEDPTSPRAL